MPYEVSESTKDKILALLAHKGTQQGMSVPDQPQGQYIAAVQCTNGTPIGNLGSTTVQLYQGQVNWITTQLGSEGWVQAQSNCYVTDASGASLNNGTWLLCVQSGSARPQMSGSPVEGASSMPVYYGVIDGSPFLCQYFQVQGAGTATNGTSTAIPSGTSATLFWPELPDINPLFVPYPEQGLNTQQYIISSRHFGFTDSEKSYPDYSPLIMGATIGVQAGAVDSMGNPATGWISLQAVTPSLGTDQNTVDAEYYNGQNWAGAPGGGLGLDFTGPFCLYLKGTFLINGEEGDEWWNAGGADDYYVGISVTNYTSGTINLYYDTCRWWAASMNNPDGRPYAN